ncbi:tail fiber domain-containing protein [Chryseobacterium oryctis]|uniref:Tail fiber domain-containing protein n=1 Tax=Chryseobacterium oryctis TaxID=2952618 RepID=A0ABT3HRV8_9FLAO|nr:tail fiber domain-containing protein [Chryseobacterium oryctis]MCW3162415.1 tail fiber domain-containing protein [Chryseobacterium oryctis]
MKKFTTLLGLILYGVYSAQSGSVGINTPAPNSDAVLDVVSTNKGFLTPRMALTSTTSPSPLSAHVAGMIVYNTATVNDVQPALYYNDGTKWVLSKGGAATATTTNVLSTSGNTITSTVNGIASTAPAINTNTLSLSGTNLTSSVNGVSSSSLDLKPVVTAATTHTLSTSGNTLTSNVNGIAPTASIITSNALTKPATNTLRSSVNGVTASPDVTLVSSVSNTLSGSSLSTSVNGVAGSAVDLKPAITAGTTHTLSTSGNTLTSNVNGIAPTASIITSNALTKPTTNTLRSSVNGVTATPDVTLVNSVSNTLNGSLLSTTVNGVTGSTVDLSSAMKNIYNADGTLTSNRTVNMAGRTLSFVNGDNSISFDTSSYGNLRVGSPTRGNIRTMGGDAYFDMFVDNGSAAQWAAFGNLTSIHIGGKTAVPMYFFTNNTTRVTITSAGNFGIGTQSPTSLLSVNGSADKPGGGSWGTFSDRRVKKDIVEFKDGLNVINKLTPVTYKYNEKSGYEDLNKEYVGFIAQDVEKAAPYMVSIIDDTQKSGLKDKRELDESALTKILVNAVKEQQQQIAELKKEIEELKKKKS